jgi:exosortase C (VPDSG-CTERM-specific)
VRSFSILVIALGLCFARPILDLIRYALDSEFNSYILLVPFISAYLIWADKGGLVLDSRPVRAFAVPPLVVGVGILIGYWATAGAGWEPGVDTYLALMMLSLLALVVGAGFLFLGLGTMRAAAFPLVLLLFVIPLPGPLLQAIVSFLQHKSADVASGLFSMSGMAFLRQDTLFQLPGIPIEVAPECSGIRSTLVLFITSLVAGYLFLQSPWRRAVLSLAVIPLALLRNGFRIFTIGELCVNIGPQMIHSPIHKKGGPLFFALSLIPFFLLLFWLRHSERHRSAGGNKKDGGERQHTLI